MDGPLGASVIDLFKVPWLWPIWGAGFNSFLQGIYFSAHSLQFCLLWISFNDTYHLGMTEQGEYRSLAGRGAPAKGHHTGFLETRSFGCHRGRTRDSRHSYIVPCCYEGPRKGKETYVHLKSDQCPRLLLPHTDFGQITEKVWDTAPFIPHAILTSSV